MRILFILKRRSYSWGQGENGRFSSGLFNSASFICDALKPLVEATKLVEVVDNNSIDKEVTAFKPTHVIIEAYWVVPEKFAVLKRIHPNVVWVVRNHSELAFLANEGMAIDWTIKYSRSGVYVSGNSQRVNDDMKVFALENKVVYLPNYYPITAPTRAGIHDQTFNLRPRKLTEIHIFCPGAIRPLKNQLAQAVAAIKTARSLNVRLNFYVNAGRIELHGDQVIKNIRALFASNLYGDKLIETPWCSHDDFVKLVATMDAVMQVSFTETFNIVGADAVIAGVALVGSPELMWSDDRLWADPTDVTDMATKLELAITHPKPNLAKRLLYDYVKDVPSTWIENLSGL